MTIALAMSIVTWIWVLAGAAIYVFVLIFLFREQDSAASLVFAGGAAVTSAAMVLGLSAGGFPVTALWVWRLVSLGWLGTATYRLASGKRETAAGKWEAAASALNVLLALMVSIPSLVAVRAFQVGIPASTAAVTRTVITIDGIRLWHGIALGMLCLGTLVFSVLFILMIQRGVPPQLESQWGGIGGGLSGWRLSPSLTYLAAAAAFGVLFAIFVVQLEPGKEQQSTTTQSASKPAQPAPKPSQPPSTATTPR